MRTWTAVRLGVLADGAGAGAHRAADPGRHRRSLPEKLGPHRQLERGSTTDLPLAVPRGAAVAEPARVQHAVDAVSCGTAAGSTVRRGSRSAVAALRRTRLEGDATDPHGRADHRRLGGRHGPL